MLIAAVGWLDTRDSARWRRLSEGEGARLTRARGHDRQGCGKDVGATGDVHASGPHVLECRSRTRARVIPKPSTGCATSQYIELRRNCDGSLSEAIQRASVMIDGQPRGTPRRRSRIFPSARTLLCSSSAAES